MEPAVFTELRLHHKPSLTSDESVWAAHEAEASAADPGQLELRIGSEAPEQSVSRTGSSAPHLAMPIKDIDEPRQAGLLAKVDGSDCRKSVAAGGRPGRE